MDKGQISRWSKGEEDLIKESFKDNDELLYQLRDFFLGLSSQVPKLKPGILEILKKQINPELSSDLPLACAQADVYFSLPPLDQVLPEMAVKIIESKDLAKQYLENKFAILEGKETLELSLESLKSWSDRYVGMFAYQWLTNSHIQSSLLNLQTIANKKVKTKEELEEDAKKESTQ